MYYPSNSNSSSNEGNETNNKTKLRTELNNLYGGRNGFLNNGEINTLVNKYNGKNTMNVKKQAYSKASTKYMNYMATTFTQDVIREIRAKMKSSPKCPTGVVGGGPTLRGMARAVTGGVRAACGGPGKPKCKTKNRINKMRGLTNENKREFKTRINKGENPKKVLTAAGERRKLR
jgi:hypothetical protein